MSERDVAGEGERIMTICNSCRYCEGFCAVFPAMEMRRAFTAQDMNYLANLCHNCTECLYACQYAPPHEFKVNVPRTLAEIRGRSYEQYAWPAPFARLLRSHGIATSLALVAALTLVLFGSVRWLGHRTLAAPPQRANFYAILPHDVMVGLFGAVTGLVVLALAVGVVRYLKDTNPVLVGNTSAVLPPLWRGVLDALQLKYLHGSGTACTTAEEVRTPWRRVYHHFTFYGFLLCMASTSVAAVYHRLGWVAPHAYTSLPVLLGTIGGIGLTIGPIGLWAVRRRRDQATLDPDQSGLDLSFITMLVLVSVSGLVLLVFRITAAMPALLLWHLATVLALLMTLPYGKFVHGLYRVAALVQYARECHAADVRASEAAAKQIAVLPSNGSFRQESA